VVVVVVDGPPQFSTLGSGWPMSKAMTRERPWASAKNSPMVPDQLGMALTETEIGFWPVCSRSSTPGVPMNLQTKTFLGISLVVDVAPLVVDVEPLVVVVAG
jgi:hypothetical protein